MLKPKETQLTGARFLADNPFALLADEPRVGKTFPAVMAADYNFEEQILVVTTASGRPVWRRAFSQLSAFPRPITVLTAAPKEVPKGVVIVGWALISDPRTQVLLANVAWDRVIGDESHYAKNFETKRTQAFYGQIIDDGRTLISRNAVTRNAKGVWVLTGTPIPNAPNDLYPMMRALCPERLKADPEREWPDVTAYEAFLKRYCVVRPKKVGFHRWIQIVMGGRNLEELRERVGDFMLRRTQADVGITQPEYELMPLFVGKKQMDALILAERDLDRRKILNAAAMDETHNLEMHLGPIRRITGEIKARGVAEAVREEFECGLDKIVLMAWHKDVMQLLKDELAQFGVVGIDGDTPAAKRGEAEQRFLKDPKIRVFVGQITAAGEAIDLSAAAELVFVESSFTPKDMKQAALRITNHGQRRQPRVRVAVLEGSIDEAFQAVLLRKWTTIREVIDYGR